MISGGRYLIITTSIWLIELEKFDELVTINRMMDEVILVRYKLA